MEYEFLNKEEKREILKTKLSSLEQQHYELSEMLKAIKDENGNVVREDVKATIERQIQECAIMHEGMLKEYRVL
jgi:hypothetical protein